MSALDLLRSLQDMDSTGSEHTQSSDTIVVDADQSGFAIVDDVWSDSDDLLLIEASDEAVIETCSDEVNKATVSTWDEAEEEGNDIEANCEDDDDERTTTIAKLENIALSVLSQLSYAMTCLVREAENDKVRDYMDEDSPHIVLHLSDRRKSTPRPDSEDQMHTRTVMFPARRKGSSSKALARLLKVVCSAHEALIRNCPLTKRDLFYSDVPLFKTQAVVDCLVDDLAATLGVSRSDLGIRASAKGLFCGSGLSISLVKGDEIRGKDTEATLIPLGESISGIQVTEDVSWVLIVEKDAVFQTLCNAGLTHHSGLNGQGILITGKGYPDMATRRLINILSMHLPMSIPILILVDADPYGIDIASVYKFGSSALRHEQDGLAAGRVDWIGVSYRDVDRLCLNKDALIPITDRDFKKAIHMLQRRQHMPERWRRELMHMLHTRRKAEIEILTSGLTLNRVAVDPKYCEGDTTSPMQPEQHTLVRYLIEKIDMHIEL